MKIEINKKQYNCKDVNNISISEYINLIETVKMPKVLNDIFNSKSDDERRKYLDKVTDTVFAKQIAPYFIEFITKVSDIPKQVLLNCNIYDLERVWLMLVYNYNNYEPVGIDMFKFNNKTYYLPNKLMSNSTVIEFLEIQEYKDHVKELENGNLKALPYIIAVLCKEKDEVFDSETIEIKAQIFNDIPLSIALEVGFFLHKQSEKYTHVLEIYSQAQTLSTLKQGVINTVSNLAGT